MAACACGPVAPHPLEGPPLRLREGAVVAAGRAERDGAAALVCAPIVSPTVEKLLSIPVATIIPRDSLVRAIEVAARKIE